jgi:cellulose synthase/poly-beta-1,6-N-acetylglucosamine synthase-like glycosyltransferase
MSETLLAITGVLLSACVFKALIAIAGIRQTLRVFEQAKDLPKPSITPKVLIVVCALREQASLGDTVRHFQALEYPERQRRILIVTTERERQEGQSFPLHGSDTIYIAEDLQRRYADVRHLHFPDPAGLKSDQMNYAIARFADVCPDWKPDEAFFAFYDADSRPAANVLLMFAAVFERYPQSNIFQQSATYVDNFFSFDELPLLSRLLLRAQAFKQTRFTFAYEIPRIRRVLRYCLGQSRSLLAMATFAPCVAHGLIVRGTLLAALPFQKRYVPEDMFWGFVASSLRHPIVFFASLDSSQTPGTVGQAFGQLSRWFQGPLLTIRYVHFLEEYHPRVYVRERLRVWLMCLFGLYDATVWIATSFIWWFLVAMSVYFGSWIAVLTVIWLVLYEISVYTLMKRFLPERQATPVQVISTLVCGALLLAVYSLPACYSVFKLIVNSPLTTKTERV